MPARAVAGLLGRRAMHKPPAGPVHNGAVRLAVAALVGRGWPDMEDLRRATMLAKYDRKTKREPAWIELINQVLAEAAGA